MPAASLLPVTIHKGKLYFLFGKENPLEDSSKGFSDFGGGKEEGSFFENAVREASEELTGFLGNSLELKKRIRKNGGTYVVKYNPGEEREYRVHLFYLPYDPAFVESYNLNHAYLWNKMDKQYLNNTKLFEKIKIEWFCETELLKREKEYRHFYFDILKTILSHKSNIKEFVMKCTKKCRSCKTRNNRSSLPRITRKQRGG